MSIDWHHFNARCFKYSALFNTEKIFHRKIVHKIDSKKNATITLRTYGTHQHYAGYSVRIIHIENGEIDRHFFKFNDYFTDYKKLPNDGYTIIEYCNYPNNFWDNPPKENELKSYWKQIENYIEQFKGE